MNIEIIIPLLAYLLVMLGVALWVYSKKQRGGFLENFFIGNRSMNGFVLAMTLMATYISASSFIGGPGAAYKYGLGWVLLSMIQLPVVWLSLGVLGKKFSILARRYNAVTLNDVLYARFQSHAIVWISGLSLLIAFFAAMTVQFIGGARLLETATGVPYGVGLLIFAGTVAVYTALGGFRGSVLNDAIQGVVMLIGALLLLTAVIYAAGGIPSAMRTLNAIDPALTSPYAPNHFLSFPMMASFWVLVCFGVIGLPHTAVRCIAYQDSRAMHRGIIIGTIVTGILMCTMHLTGVLGRAVISDLTIPDQVVPALMVRVLPPVFAGIFLAAPMAAIMSTVNAQLLQSAATLIKDLFLRVRPHASLSETKLSVSTRLITFVLGLLLIVAAWQPPDMLIWLNLLAFGGLQAVFLWPLVLGLYWERANAAGAILSMVTGGTCYILLTLLKPNLLGWHIVVPSLTVSLIGFLTGVFLFREGNKK
ncbi:MAG: sodium/pantothenate symporter [Burkholderiales bacterium]|jgi:sodium/pantothenate symporter|nr:sodium/pantothenate symporter [Burkholderiales bacterium]